MKRYIIDGTLPRSPRERIERIREEAERYQAGRITLALIDALAAEIDATPEDAAEIEDEALGAFTRALGGTITLGDPDPGDVCWEVEGVACWCCGGAPNVHAAYCVMPGIEERESAIDRANEADLARRRSGEFYA